MYGLCCPRLLCKFREIWLTGNWQSRALFTRQKNKTSARSPALASAPIAPKICQGQLQTIYSEFSKFHPNPFTSGGVIAERVNVVETRHKVFPILGEASSPSNYTITEKLLSHYSRTLLIIVCSTKTQQLATAEFLLKWRYISFFR